MKRFFEILLIAAAACSVARADDFRVYQDALTVAVSSNPAAIVTNGQTACGYLYKVTARLPQGLDAVQVAFVHNDDGSTFFSSNLVAAVVATGFGDGSYDGEYYNTGTTHNGHPVYQNASGRVLFTSSDADAWTLSDSVSDGEGLGAYQSFASSNDPPTGLYGLLNGTAPGGSLSATETIVSMPQPGLLHGAYRVLTSSANTATNTALQLILLERR